MKITDRNVARLAVVQHLRAVFGIKVKNWNKNKTSSSSSKQASGSSVKIFGVPFENLPHCSVVDYGNIPCFLVDACATLREHVQTEGLFRKSGSVVRLKALKAKLDQGEDCIPSAQPCDLAGLLKQFFRELPEPVLPPELQDSLLKAQQLHSVEDRASATQLLSCVLPERSCHTLRYFFIFLRDVSQRFEENKMDSSNLSVIFAPNLLHSEVAEKMSSSTEKKLKLQAAVVHFFIENAQSFGVVPLFILERIPAMVGCETGIMTPLPDHAEEGETESARKKRHRRSFGEMVNGALNKLKTNKTPTNTPQPDATPVILTPNTKRKLPAESGLSYSFSNKKRRSIKKNLGLELLPSTIFSSITTPSSGHYDSSPAVSLDSSQSASVGRSRRPSASSARRKSRRLSNKHVNRVESGTAGCFSPKVTKKELVRKSLRQRFSLGKSTKDSSVFSHSLTGAKASETIGWRLATQESVTSFHFSEASLTPAVLQKKGTSPSAKNISKSEDNLRSPQHESHRTSWGGPIPGNAHNNGSMPIPADPSACIRSSKYCSEPVLSVPKVDFTISKHLCCSSVESLDGDSASHRGNVLTDHTLVMVKRAFTESGSDLYSVTGDCGRSVRSFKPDSTCLQETPIKSGTEISCPNIPREGNAVQNLTEIFPLTPLHIDSSLFETGMETLLRKENSFANCVDESSPVDHSRLINALDIGSPPVFKLSAGEQSTPCRANVLDMPPPLLFPEKKVNSDGQHMRVADHIQRFNTLTLRSRSPKAKVYRSPLKFQRTPVRQSVRRINSLLADDPQQSHNPPSDSMSPLVKAVSLESGLTPKARLREKKVPKQPPPKVLPKRCSGRLAALDDVTNRVQAKLNIEADKKGGVATLAKPENQLLLHASKVDCSRYRGSPKNPLSEGKLLSAMKPINF